MFRADSMLFLAGLFCRTALWGHLWLPTFLEAFLNNNMHLLSSKTFRVAEPVGYPQFHPVNQKELLCDNNLEAMCNFEKPELHSTVWYSQLARNVWNQISNPSSVTASCHYLVKIIFIHTFTRLLLCWEELDISLYAAIYRLIPCSGWRRQTWDKSRPQSVFLSHAVRSTSNLKC